MISNLHGLKKKLALSALAVGTLCSVSSGVRGTGTACGSQEQVAISGFMQTSSSQTDTVSDFNKRVAAMNLLQQDTKMPLEVKDVVNLPVLEKYPSLTQYGVDMNSMWAGVGTLAKKNLTELTSNIHVAKATFMALREIESDTNLKTQTQIFETNTSIWETAVDMVSTMKSKEVISDLIPMFNKIFQHQLARHKGPSEFFGNATEWEESRQDYNLASRYITYRNSRSNLIEIYLKTFEEVENRINGHRDNQAVRDLFKEKMLEDMQTHD